MMPPEVAARTGGGTLARNDRAAIASAGPFN
jgi:hypothetical protein